MKEKVRRPNTQYVLSLSYGKDSLACLEAIWLLGLPLDRIVHAELWATDTIPADLPPMVEFKAKADKIIKERYGIEVEHVCAMKNGEKVTFEKLFFRRNQRGTRLGNLRGFPTRVSPYCLSGLKSNTLDRAIHGASRNVIHYVGIASDETKRIERHLEDGKVLPLVEVGWD